MEIPDMPKALCLHFTCKTSSCSIVNGFRVHENEGINAFVLLASHRGTESFFPFILDVNKFSYGLIVSLQVDRDFLALMTEPERNASEGTLLARNTLS